jgi:alpha-beta hydrolase superfamily lysophospholipase
VPFFEGASGKVYYRHWAAPEPVAALAFLHGYGEHTGLYHRYAAELRAHGVELWALDQVGHGLSEGERGDIDSLDALVENASRLVSLVEQQRPGLPVVLAGHSLGSSVTAVLASTEPQRFAGLVVSGALLSPAAWLLEAGYAGTELDLELDELSADPFTGTA